MKRYVTIQCSACKRTKDSLIDPTHYALDTCTITLNCEGRLAPIGYTSDGSTTPGVAPTGLLNWYPRGTNLAQAAQLTDPVLYGTSTGLKQQVIIALPGVYPSTSVLTLKLVAEQQTAKDYRQYIFRKSSAFTIINGIEDTVAKKVLRYSISGTNPDYVEVYVNGVKRTKGLGAQEYQLSDTAAMPNSILFNSNSLDGSTQVDVIVTKAATVSSATLKFLRVINDSARTNIGAWEGIDTVTYAKGSTLEKVYSLFCCDFTTSADSLVLDVRLRLNITAGAESTVRSITPGDEASFAGALLLFSRSEVFTQLDRDRTKCVKLDSLVSGGIDYLVMKLIAGERALFVTANSSTNIFPALEVQRFSTSTLQSTNLLGSANATELNNNLVVGPTA